MVIGKVRKRKPAIRVFGLTPDPDCECIACQSQRRRLGRQDKRKGFKVVK